MAGQTQLSELLELGMSKKTQLLSESSLTQITSTSLETGEFLKQTIHLSLAIKQHALSVCAAWEILHSILQVTFK